jgi:hypothetical protein
VSMDGSIEIIARHGSFDLCSSNSR